MAGFGLGACVCVCGRGAVTLLRSGGALWLCTAPVCRLSAHPAVCFQLRRWSNPSLSYGQPLGRARSFTNLRQRPAVRLSSACNTPWLLLLPHPCSLICSWEKGRGQEQTHGTARGSLALGCWVSFAVSSTIVSWVSEVRDECGSPCLRYVLLCARSHHLKS